MYLDNLCSVVLAARYLSAISNGSKHSPSGLEQSASIDPWLETLQETGVLHSTVSPHRSTGTCRVCGRETVTKEARFEVAVTGTSVRFPKADDQSRIFLKTNGYMLR